MRARHMQGYKRCVSALEEYVNLVLIIHSHSILLAMLDINLRPLAMKNLHDLFDYFTTSCYIEYFATFAMNV